MIDSEKLNHTIIKFEDEVKELKNVNEMYSKIKDLSDEIKTESGLYRNLFKKLNQMADEVEINLERGNESLAKVHELHNLMRSDFSEDIEHITINLNNEIDGIKKENKKHFLEFEQLLSSKLDRIKSDMELEVRNGNLQITQVLDNKLERKFLSLEKELKERLQEQNSKIKKLNTIIIINMVLVLVNIGFWLFA